MCQQGVVLVLGLWPLGTHRICPGLESELKTTHSARQARTVLHSHRNGSGARAVTCYLEIRWSLTIFGSPPKIVYSYEVEFRVEVDDYWTTGPGIGSAEEAQHLVAFSIGKAMPRWPIETRFGLGARSLRQLVCLSFQEEESPNTGRHQHKFAECFCHCDVRDQLQSNDRKRARGLLAEWRRCLECWFGDEVCHFKTDRMDGSIVLIGL